MDNRLDLYLVENNMTPSRERAKALVMAGIVYVNGVKADKAGEKVPANAIVEIRGKDLQYVSRGGLKLEKAMQAFHLDLNGKTCMDIGASTGGFTDCMLQNGATKVYAVDVGYGQLAWTLRTNPQVVNMERTNIRNITPTDIEDLIDFFSIDVSFISLSHIFPVMKTLTSHHGEAVALIKPQFEAGKDKVGKKGVVRDAEVHIDVITKCMHIAEENGFHVQALDHSPIKGPEGNIEFLMHVSVEKESTRFTNEDIENLVNSAHSTL